MEPNREMSQALVEDIVSTCSTWKSNATAPIGGIKCLGVIYGYISTGDHSGTFVRVTSEGVNASARRWVDREDRDGKVGTLARETGGSKRIGKPIPSEIWTPCAQAGTSAEIEATKRAVTELKNLEIQLGGQLQIATNHALQLVYLLPGEGGPTCPCKSCGPKLEEAKIIWLTEDTSPPQLRQQIELQLQEMGIHQMTPVKVIDASCGWIKEILVEQGRQEVARGDKETSRLQVDKMIGGNTEKVARAIAAAGVGLRYDTVGVKEWLIRLCDGQTPSEVQEILDQLRNPEKIEKLSSYAHTIHQSLQQLSWGDVVAKVSTPEETNTEEVLEEVAREVGTVKKALKTSRSKGTVSSAIQVKIKGIVAKLKDACGGIDILDVYLSSGKGGVKVKSVDELMESHAFDDQEKLIEAIDEMVHNNSSLLDAEVSNSHAPAATATATTTTTTTTTTTASSPPPRRRQQQPAKKPKTTGTPASSEDGLSHDDIRHNLGTADEKIDFIDLTEETSPDWQSYQNWKGNTAVAVLKQEIDGEMIYHAVTLAKVANELGGGYDVVIIDPLSDKSEYKDQLEVLAKSINQGNNRCQGIIYTNLEDPTADVCADLSMILARQISKNLGTGASLKDICLQQVRELDKDMYPHGRPVVESFTTEKKDDKQDRPSSSVPTVASGKGGTPQQQQLHQRSVLSANASFVLRFICDRITASQRGEAEQLIRDTLDKITGDRRQEFLTELHKKVTSKSDPDIPISFGVSLKDLDKHVSETFEQVSQRKQSEQWKEQVVQRQTQRQEQPTEEQREGLHM